MHKSNIHTSLTKELSQQINQLLEHSENTSFFQSPVFFELAELVPNYKPLLITAENEEGEILGSLLAIRIGEGKSLKGRLSERGVIFSGPVLHSGLCTLDSALHALLKQLLNSIGSNVLFTQFRNFYDTNELKDIYLNNGFNFRARSNLLIDCRNKDLVWNGMSENRKRQLRRMKVTQSSTEYTTEFHREETQRNDGTMKSVVTPSRRHDVTYGPAKTLEEVKALYNILHNLYKHKVRKPLPPFEYFQHFFEKIHNTEWGKIFVVKYEDKVVGGIVCPVTPGKTVYEMYVCGLDKELKDKGVYPSVLATWAGIEFAMENGIPEFDFMGMGIPGRPYGVRDFKMRFGGEVVNYGRWTKINNPVLYHIAELGYNVMAVLKRV